MRNEQYHDTAQPSGPIPDWFEQPTLPIAAHSDRYVGWINVSIEHRKRLLGRKTIVTMLTDPDTGALQRTRIKADQISQLQDPQLRVALELQDAAQSVGSFEHSTGYTSSHFVSVDATNEGLDSVLSSATFTGVTVGSIDTFMENLRRFDPEYEGSYGDL